MARATIMLDSNSVRVPEWVRDLDSFRRWAHSDEFPETGRICFLNGEVWVDMSKEQIFSHNDVKAEYGSVLRVLSRRERLGRYFVDGIFLTHDEVGLACGPDGAFASRESLREGRIRLIEGVREGFVELEGTLDMVLEVVSTSSSEKDTVPLRDLYWRAGIQEYWLVDARGDPLVFNILRHTPKGYVPTRKQAGGWVKSAVFGKAFRLLRHDDEEGNPEYTLEVK